jgi:hypothetical protein
VLEADPPAVVEERLEVLVVVVEVVLAADEGADHLRDGLLRVLHLPDVAVAAEAARDVAFRKRLALERRHDADDVLPLL